MSNLEYRLKFLHLEPVDGVPLPESIAQGNTLQHQDPTDSTKTFLRVHSATPGMLVANGNTSTRSMANSYAFTVVLFGRTGDVYDELTSLGPDFENLSVKKARFNSVTIISAKKVDKGADGYSVPEQTVVYNNAVITGVVCQEDHNGDEHIYVDFMADVKGTLVSKTAKDGSVSEGKRTLHDTGSGDPEPAAAA